QLHDEVDQGRHVGAGRGQVAGVKGLDDVGVVQLGEYAHLAVETLPQRGVAVVVDGQHLDGDAATHQPVLAEVDQPHAARADLIEDTIVAQQQAVDAAGEDALELKGGE